MPVKIIMATRNSGKIKEIARLLKELAVAVKVEVEIEVVSVSRILPTLTVEEDRLTFAGNAAKKALAVCLASGEIALADDSGLEVEALQGLPGVKSARFAGPEAADEENNALLLQRLSGLPMEKRRAAFRCAMAVAVPAGKMPGSGQYEYEDEHRISADTAAITTADQEQLMQPHLEIVEESCYGLILEAPRGDGGFGYDPLFLYEPSGLTFAQLSPAEKNKVSHRAKSLRRLLPVLYHLVQPAPPEPG